MKYTKRFQIRLTKEQYDLVKKHAPHTMADFFRDCAMDEIKRKQWLKRKK